MKTHSSPIALVAKTNCNIECYKHLDEAQQLASTLLKKPQVIGEQQQGARASLNVLESRK